jgi:two-component sensor histidine kinase
MNLLETTSPFYLRLNHNHKIVEAGSLMLKCLQGDALGKTFERVFDIPPSWQDVFAKAFENGRSGLWFFNNKDNTQSFRSEIFKEENGVYLVLSNPVINQVYKLKNYHLMLSDFAPHDAICELVFLQQFSSVALEDALQLNQYLELKHKALKASSDKLSQMNEELTYLLGEVHHRVKNNLALIMGIMEMKKSQLQSNALLELMNEMQGRLRAVTLIHNLMYRSNSFARINFKDYIVELVQQVSQSFEQPDRIQTAYDMEDVYLESSRAMLLAMVMNELITNSFEHAFKGKSSGLLSLSLYRRAAFIQITIKDDGPGVTIDYQPGHTLGMKLLEMLTRQMKGFYEMKNDNGLEVSIQIPVEVRENVAGNTQLFS